MNDIPQNFLAGWDILVVDDEEDSLEVAHFILDFYGATVHVASNGREGLELALAARPKIIISDLSMPEMDGWDMLEHLRKNLSTRDIPVIALTAHAMVGDRERAMAAGFHNYITKPLSAESFIRRLLVLLMDIPVLSGELKL